MESERWERLKELCLAALHYRDNDRHSFLEKSCGTDEALRHEVESLLAHHEADPDFLESPSAPRWLPVDRPPIGRLDGSKVDRRAGTTVSHYQIVETLGAGGMGVVYKAMDAKLGRFVALKFLSEVALGSSSGAVRPAIDTSYNSQTLERFQREARAASALDHPNICTVYEIDQHEGSPFIAMQFLDGQTLKSEIDNQPLPVERIVNLGLQVIDGLVAAHAQGIVHRDIKAANIFITRRGEAKILDFGLAKLAGNDKASVETAQEPVPRSGTIPLSAPPDAAASVGAFLGTTGYMSPEQILRQDLDSRTDLFSFGTVLYEMATGELPFPGETPSTVLQSILRKIPPSPSKLNPDLPPALAQIICKAMEKDRGARYQTASELRADLRRLQQTLDSTAENVSASRATKRWPLAVLAALFAASCLGVYWYLHHRPAARLSEQDTIVLADFTNTTGDPVFDETLKQALRVQLEQSPFLNVLSDQKMAEQLRYMGRPRDTRLTSDVARDLCLRAGSKAMLLGSISSLGKIYILGVNVVDCQTGNSLDSEQVEAGSRENVLQAVGKASSRLRAKLGESLASIRKYDTPLEQATTASLEALQSYSLGVKTRLTEGNAAAIPLFERATLLDPNFAMAYARLGSGYFELSQSKRAKAELTKAYGLRDRVSDAERFFIDSRYYVMGTGQLDRAILVCNLWKQTYPRDYVPYEDLGVTYSTLGQAEKSLHEQAEALRLYPTSNGLVYANLAGAYLSLNRFAESKEVLEQASSRKIGIPMQRILLYYLAFFRDDLEEMKRQATAEMNQPELATLMLAVQADTEAYYGHLLKARELTHRAVDSARRQGDWESASGFAVVSGMREAELGNLPEARKELAATTLAQPLSALGALVLALADEPVRALAAAHDLQRQSPLDTVLNNYWLPTVYAAIELSHDRPVKTINELEMVLPYELGNVQTPTTGALFPVYIRGLAFLATRQGAQAAAEFQKIVDHPGMMGNCILGPLAHLALARAYALEAGISRVPRAGGQRIPSVKDAQTRSDVLAKARAAYQDFFVLWKDADPDLPILKQAQAEYRKLK
jgi:serine/threonine protein kinase